MFIPTQFLWVSSLGTTWLGPLLPALMRLQSRYPVGCGLISRFDWGWIGL